MFSLITGHMFSPSRTQCIPKHCSHRWGWFIPRLIVGDGPDLLLFYGSLGNLFSVWERESSTVIYVGVFFFILHQHVACVTCMVSLDGLSYIMISSEKRSMAAPVLLWVSTNAGVTSREGSPVLGVSSFKDIHDVRRVM